MFFFKRSYQHIFFFVLARTPVWQQTCVQAVYEYGYLIHEFDPWFNFRATQYLAEHGWSKFAHWYDYMSWYPIGRPIGTTTYPGMQFAGVWIWEAMKHVPKALAAPAFRHLSRCEPHCFPL
ncbi:unnamed protein product [Polarella glacialis]|uniref:dolichyl-diphosphooligosaccharide--protein glycotransferase n=1 Tax=Polarella glacialis TaxID=89957 RepID=A0A813G5F3_POLGL|nr:unnamed protein product [Polarella glacialis]